MSGQHALSYQAYPIEGTEEWLLRIGPPEAPPILFLPPLLEEMNRTRALIVAVMRAMAHRGHGCWLPDLPGTGESLRPLEGCGWDDWRSAAREAGRTAAEAAGRPPAVASLRGGALLDDAVQSRGVWRFAPTAGASLVRDLERSSLAAKNDRAGDARLLAGYPVGDGLREALREALPAQSAATRTIRLSSDPAEADRKFEGPALWRRSEPANAPELAAALAVDLAQWIAQCEAS